MNNNPSESARELQRLSARKRWAGKSKAERSKIMRAVRAAKPVTIARGRIDTETDPGVKP